MDRQAVDAEARQFGGPSHDALRRLSREIENSLRMEASANQIDKSESIAESPATPIDPRLRPNQMCKIGEDIAAHLKQSAIESESPFAPKVEGICNLRISKTNARGATTFAPKMDAYHTSIPHDSTIRRELPTKIDVFEPTI